MTLTNHSPRLTHLDALSHQAIDGQVYPGRPFVDSVTAAGATHASTATFGSGVITQGILLDFAADGPLPAGYPVNGTDLDAAEERQGVTLESGDALVVRGGWSMADAPRPGMTTDAVRWMHQRGVSLYAGDISSVLPPVHPGEPAPLHKVALVMLGMPLIDAAHVDDLAAVCAELPATASCSPSRRRASTA